jgi:hypothetical protein
MNDFKILAEFPKYEINEKGELYNKNTNFKLSGSLNKGYKVFRIYNKNGKNTTVRLHQLLAQAFIENPNNHNQVDHIDNNKLNNNLQNLRWCTRSQNQTNREIFSHRKEGCPEKRFKYVNWNKRDKNWQGTLKVNGKLKYIGTSDNDEEVYIMCLDFLYSVFKDNEFYSSKIQEDLIKYKIKDN